MAKVPARPPVSLQYLLWDGTDSVDSFALGEGLHKAFRCVNLLDDSPAAQEFVSTASAGKPRVFQPAGPDGKTFSAALWQRGMFEFPRTFYDAPHANAGGDRAHIFAYSGHGIPGFMFSESAVLVGASNPIAGSMSSFSFSPLRWNHANTKVVLFSACRQLAGRPQQFRWSRTMRGTNVVHCILSYRNTAPAASTSASINRSFVASLAKGATFLEAWQSAHSGPGLRNRWAALVYKSAIGDRLDLWAKSGSLASAPTKDEDILYFDRDHTSCRAVTEPRKVLNLTPTFRSSPSAVIPTGLSAGDKVPPWTLLRPGTKLNLAIHWTDPSETFKDGDVVWLAALQVRPDYAGPFDITNLFEIEGAPSGDVNSWGRIHDESAGWKPDTYGDLYEFRIDRAAMPWLSHDPSWNSITIPIKIIGQPNDHLPVFYFMLRVERGTSEFGIPTKIFKGVRVADQARLVDDFQFFVFLITQT